MILAKLLAHTRLRHLQWINLDRHRLEFVPLSSNGDARNESITLEQIPRDEVFYDSVPP